MIPSCFVCSLVVKFCCCRCARPACLNKRNCLPVPSPTDALSPRLETLDYATFGCFFAFGGRTPIPKGETLSCCLPYFLFPFFSFFCRPLRRTIPKPFVLSLPLPLSPNISLKRRDICIKRLLPDDVSPGSPFSGVPRRARARFGIMPRADVVDRGLRRFS